jgi:hypothetical protein
MDADKDVTIHRLRRLSMISKDDPGVAQGQEERSWIEGETLGREPIAAGPVDPGSDPDGDDAVIVAVDEDLDELDAPLVPDFHHEFETWAAEDLESDLDAVEEDEEEDEDEAEIRLLHELGIDLDAPDGELVPDLVFNLDPDDTADEGVAA